jgi:cobalt-zinc-cadmium efflux system outer membrane protein
LLGYFGSQLADLGTDQHGPFIEQEFVRGDKLQRNRQVLQYTLRVQSCEAQAQRLRVLTDVRTRFYEALAAQQELAAIREFTVIAERGLQVANFRKEAEEASEIDVLQSRTLLSEIQLARAQVEARYRGAWGDLTAIAGVPDLMPMRLASDVPAPIEYPSWETIAADTLARSPEMAAASELVGEKRAFLARQQVQPVPNLIAQVGGGYDNGTNTGLINVQVGAPLPLVNKNTGNIAAAQADYVRAVQNARRVEYSIRSRLARTAQEYDAALASVQKYEQEIIPQTQRALTLSEQAYAAGELYFLQVLVVRRSFFDAQVELIKARARLAQAGALVEGLVLTGGLDLTPDYTSGDGLRGQSFGGQ